MWRRAHALDRALAGGAEVTGDLTRRSAQLVQPATRLRLAAGFRAAVEAARQPSCERSASDLDLACEEILAAAPALERLIGRLCDGVPVDPRGVALASLLLSDEHSPIYRGAANDELWRQTRAALAALDAGR